MEPLNFEDVGGVFLIMISGVTLSWIFTGLTFLWNVRNVAIRHDVIASMFNNYSLRLQLCEIIFKACILQGPFKKELIEELRFLIKCNRKKIVKRRKESLKTINNDSTGF